MRVLTLIAVTVTDAVVVVEQARVGPACDDDVDIGQAFGQRQFDVQTLHMCQQDDLVERRVGRFQRIDFGLDFGGQRIELSRRRGCIERCRRDVEAAGAGDRGQRGRRGPDNADILAVHVDDNRRGHGICLRCVAACDLEPGQRRIGRIVEIGGQIGEIRAGEVLAQNGAAVAGAAVDQAGQQPGAAVEFVVAEGNRLQAQFILDLNVRDPFGAIERFGGTEEDAGNKGIARGQEQGVVRHAVIAQILRHQRVHDGRQVRRVGDGAGRRFLICDVQQFQREVTCRCDEGRVHGANRRGCGRVRGKLGRADHRSVGVENLGVTDHVDCIEMPVRSAAEHKLGFGAGEVEIDPAQLRAIDKTLVCLGIRDAHGVEHCGDAQQGEIRIQNAIVVGVQIVAHCSGKFIDQRIGEAGVFQIRDLDRQNAGRIEGAGYLEGTIDGSGRGAFVALDTQQPTGKGLVGGAEEFDKLCRWVGAGRVGLKFADQSVHRGAFQSQEQEILFG